MNTFILLNLFIEYFKTKPYELFKEKTQFHIFFDKKNI